MDGFINSLSADLQPTRPLKIQRLWLLGLGVLVAVSAIILALTGLRPDAYEALNNGTFLWKTGGFLLAFLCSIPLINRLSRPQYSLRKADKVLLAIPAIIFGIQFIRQFNILTIDDLLVPQALHCLLFISLSSVVAGTTLWAGWLRQCASSYPKLLGAVTGFASASLAGAAYSLHCDQDSILYIATYYGLTILAFSVIGKMFAGRLLTW